MFRRSFTTTARLFRRSNGKPPAEESIPPPPRNDPKPDENSTKTENASQPENSSREENPNFAEHVKGTLNPRSKHFILAFANPKIPSEERSRNLLLVTIATFTAWATEPWMMPLGQGQWFPSREEYLVDLIAYTIVNSPTRQKTASRAGNP